MSSIGRYEIVKKLGEGGMGKVFLAEDSMLGRRVAVKVISSAEGDSQQAAWLRKRFLQEARVIALLNHPSIVLIYDIGEHEGQAFIVMEYVDGMSLSGLSATRPLERGELIRIVKETSSGLDYAHTQHVIHRDIKPANLMIDARGMVKIADFGIAKLANSSLTTTNMVMGTLEYMAPEQLRNDPLDGRSDQYSLAALTYALLTGVPAFAAASFAALAFKICNDPPAKPHIVNPELPPVLADVFEKALAKRPEDRFNTCSEFAAALEMALMGSAQSTVAGLPLSAFNPATGGARATGPASGPLTNPTYHLPTRTPFETPQPRSATAQQPLPPYAGPAQPTGRQVPSGPPSQQWRPAPATGQNPQQPWSPPPPPATGHNPQWSPPAATGSNPQWSPPPTTGSNPQWGQQPSAAPAIAPQQWGQPAAPAPKAGSGIRNHIIIVSGLAICGIAGLWIFHRSSSSAAQQQPDTSQTPGSAPVSGAANPPEERSKPPVRQSQTTGDEHKRTVRPVDPPPPREVREVRTVLAEGSLVWTGDLDAGQQIDLGAPSSAGSISSSLPGVPVTVEVHPPSVRVVTPPGPENGWRHLVVRNDGRKQVMIIVKWTKR